MKGGVKSSAGNRCPCCGRFGMTMIRINSWDCYYCREGYKVERRRRKELSSSSVENH